MSAARITRERSEVDHLAVWAYDRTSAAESYSSGRHVPLCGQERRHDVQWGFSTWTAELAPPATKRLCARCALLLEDLTELASLPVHDSLPGVAH